MRVLWVKLGGLWPLDAGGRLRSFHIVSELSKRHRVTILTTHASESERDGLLEHLPRAERIVSFPHAAPKVGSLLFATALARSWLSSFPVDLGRWRVPALRSELARRLAEGSTDVVIADFLCAAANVSCESTVPRILFEHNVEYHIWKRLARVERRWWRRLALELEWRKVRRFESRACRRATTVVAVSDADRSALRRLAPEARIRVVPTGVDTTFYSPNGTKELPARLVFTGSMDWYPNQDGVTYFVESVLPGIRREVPEAFLTVVGRAPPARLLALAARNGIEVTGRVVDVRPFIAASEVYVVPLRVGGGTRLKIFEALAMGKAVVSTRIGAEGLPLVPGEHFLCADDPADFAAAVVGLLRDPERRRALGRAGRRLVAERHSWTQVAREFESVCGEVTGHAN